jgi:hypothetical protein
VRPRYLAILAVLAALVVAALLLLLPNTGSQATRPTGQMLFPGLEQQVNEATELQLRGAGDATLVTLGRAVDGWQIEQLGGYPANWALLQPALAGLAQARVAEVKTSNPDYYPRLGVEDTGAAGAGGLRVLLSAGDERYSVIMGKPAESRPGRYARLPDSAESWLVDFTADLPRTALEWAEQAIVDLPAAQVAEFTITHADGERVNVSKLSADDADYRLAALPAGREPVSSWAVNALGGLFANLQMSGVRPAAELDWSSAMQLQALAFSGLTLTAQLLEHEGEWWLQLEAGGDEPAGAADGINSRVSGWAYQLPAYKAEAMNKRMSDLLKPLAEAG